VVSSANNICTHTVPDFPLKRNGLAAASFDATFRGDILACGGGNRGPWASSSQACYHYWSEENRWIEALPMNYARFGATMHAIYISEIQAPPTSILVLGGGESAVETFNLYGGWREHANASLPNDSLQDACSVLVDSPTEPYISFIHLLGGLLGGKQHYRLLVSHQGLSEGWEAMHDMPVSLQNHACVAASIGQSSGIVVTGGYEPASSTSNRAFFYDLNLELWTELSELPEPRGFHSMGLIGQGVPAIFSGVTGDQGPTADIVTWSESERRWTTWPNALSTARVQGGAFTSSDPYNCN